MRRTVVSRHPSVPTGPALFSIQRQDEPFRGLSTMTEVLRRADRTVGPRPRTGEVRVRRRRPPSPPQLPVTQDGARQADVLPSRGADRPGTAVRSPPNGWPGPLSVAGGSMRAMTTSPAAQAAAATLADSAAYTEAVGTAATAAAAYYATGESALDDDAYDRLVRGIAAYEAEHPRRCRPARRRGRSPAAPRSGMCRTPCRCCRLDNVFCGGATRRPGPPRWSAGSAARCGRGAWSQSLTASR